MLGGNLIFVTLDFFDILLFDSIKDEMMNNLTQMPEFWNMSAKVIAIDIYIKNDKFQDF